MLVGMVWYGIVVDEKVIPEVTTYSDTISPAFGGELCRQSLLVPALRDSFKSGNTGKLHHLWAEI